jgi:hypothetical protein
LASYSFENLTRHLHEAFPNRAGQVIVLSVGRDVPLDEEVAPFGQDRGRATTTPAELRHFALFSDDLMDFHVFY